MSRPARRGRKVADEDVFDCILALDDAGLEGARQACIRDGIVGGVHLFIALEQARREAQARDDWEARK